MWIDTYVFESYGYRQKAHTKSVLYIFFYKNIHILLLNLQLYYNNNNEIKRNNNKDVTKTCPCFSFLEN